MDINKTLESIQNQIKEIQDGRKDKISMIVFSGDLDKLLASFIIATGSVAMGMEAVMFFTFWGTPALRDKNKKGKGKNLFGKMFSFMLPKGASKVKLSRMNMWHGHWHDEILDEEKEYREFRWYVSVSRRAWSKNLCV